MKALIERLVRGRAVIVGLIVAYTAAGVMALRNLPIEAYPDVTNIQAEVVTLWPGHAAEEVEKFVTIPVENQMNSLPQRASLRSISMFGLSVVTITFEDDADNYKARSLVSQQFAQVQLPTGAQAIGLARFDGGRRNLSLHPPSTAKFPADGFARYRGLGG